MSVSKILFAIFLFTCAAFAQQIIAPIAVNGAGQPWPQLVTVCNNNPGNATCSSLATLYTDNTLQTACSGSNMALSSSSAAGCSNPGYADNSGNVIAYTSAGTSYWCQYSGVGIIPYSRPCPSTQVGTIDVPTTTGNSGANVCQRILNLEVALPGRAISSQNDGAGVIQDCGSTDLQTTASVSTVFVGGGGTGGIRTCAGWHVGDRDRILGDNVGKGGTGINANTGTNWLVTSTFPTCQASGGGITMSAATSGATSVTFNLANGAGATNLILAPFDMFVVTNGTGDSQTYTIGNCTGGAGNGCITSPGAGTWYQLTPGGTAVINIFPALAQTQVGATIIGLLQAVWRFGEPVATSPQEMLLSTGFINGDSANGSTGVGIGIASGAEAQENSRAEDIYVRDISTGIRIMGSHRSGTWRNLNVAYVNGSVGCPTPGNGSPGTIPLEVAPLNMTIDGFTLFETVSGPCTPAQMTKGGIHITDNPINTGVKNQVLRITNWHVEMNGTGAPNTGDGVLIDSTGGNIILDNGTLCPAASACLNGIHVASTFVGTLFVNDVSCNASGGTTNWIKDDVNGNTIPCSGILNGTGWYSIALDGTAWTNVACGSITKGWCISSSGIQGKGAVGFVRAPQLQNFTTPILDSTSGIVASSMTPGAGTTPITNMTWPVTTGKTYEMMCYIPVTFAASATIKLALFSVSGPVTLNQADLAMWGNIGAAAAFSYLETPAAGSIAAAQTPASGAPGTNVTEGIHLHVIFATTATGTIGLEYIGNGTNNVTILALSTCRVTQTS